MRGEVGYLSNDRDVTVKKKLRLLFMKKNTLFIIFFATFCFHPFRVLQCYFV